MRARTSPDLPRRAIVALSTFVALGTSAVALDRWAQRRWLAEVWTHHRPHAHAWAFAAAGTAIAAWIAVLLAARAGRRGFAPAPALRWTPPLACAAWASLWGLAAPPVQRFDAYLAACVAAAAWSVLVAAASWRREAAWPRRLRTAEIVALELAVTAFLVEAGLRVWRVASDSPTLATAGTDVDAWIRAHRRAPGSPHLGFPANSEGMVDDEPSALGPDAPWIACVGDSFSVGVVPHHRHYTTLAERELGLPVYNLGVVAAGPREYLRMVELHALPRSPRLIVVALFLGNDLDDVERPRGTWLESWIDPGEVLLRVVPGRLGALAGLRRERRDPVHDLATPEELESRMPWLADPLREIPACALERHRWIELGRAWSCLPENLGRFATMYERLLRIRAAAGDVPVACLVFPDEYHVEDRLWQDLLDAGLDPRSDRFLAAREVVAWLEEHGFAHVDLLPRLRAIEPLEDGCRHVFHLRDTHFNARGNAIAAEALVELARSAGVDR